MAKPKLLCWCDFLIASGFGNVAKNLLDTVHEEYDVSVVGINNYGQKKYDATKYFVYPVNKEDPLGFRILLDVAEREKPDIIFLFQDPFHIHELLSQLKTKSPKSKIVSYFPIDGYPFAKIWENVIAESDGVITYSDWAIDLINEAIPNQNKKIYKLYHGVDTKTFHPLPMGEIIAKRNELGINNKFLVLNVNRFQPRKAIPLSVRIFSMFAKGYKKCKCGNMYPIHFKRCDVNGCGPEDIVLTQAQKKDDVYYYMHMMNVEYSMGMTKTNTLQHHCVNMGFTNEDVGKIIGINPKNIYEDKVPDSEINLFYNIANVNISTSTGEGCGLSLLESQAAGTRSIAPKNSAIPEQLNGTGVLVKNAYSYAHQMDNGHWRPAVDCEAFVQALEDEYARYKKKRVYKEVSKACIDNVNTNFQWADKVELLKSVFREVLNETK